MDTLLTLACENHSNRAITHYPIAHGVPLRPGRVRPGDALALRLPDGALRPVQTQVLETAPDGSVRWLLLDFEVALAANETLPVALVTAAAPPPAAAVSVTTTDDAIVVRTPRLTARFDRRQFGLFASYAVDGRELLRPGSDIIVEDQQGKLFYASLAAKLDTRVVVAGPLRTVVEVSGRHTAEDGSELLGFRVRYTFTPHAPGVRLAYKFTNQEMPEQGVFLRRIALEATTTLGHTTRKVLRQVNHGVDWFPRRVEVRENVELMNYGAIHEAAKSRYGAAAEGKVLLRNLSSLKEDLGAYPYFLRPGNVRADMSGGLRQVYPYVGVQGDGGTALTWFFAMEVNFPKAVTAARERLTWDIWPAFAGDLRLRRGMAKEHEFYLALTPATLTAEEIESRYFDHELVGLGVLGSASPPVSVTFDPAYIVAAQVLDLHRFLRYDLDRYVTVEEKLGTAAVRGSLSSRGMLDVGDTISSDRSWAHNNENDAILHGLREYLRRRDGSHLPPAIWKARHNAHVDLIAFDPDPLRQGTMPAHCPEHTDGATYPSHMWVEGLLAAYYLSGETDLRDAALSVGENMLRWQKLSPAIFYADSRECGWPMLAWLALHTHTGEQRWLDACEEVFQFYRHRMTDDGMIYYALPHGVGTMRTGYGEFVGWRACFFYYERTGRPDVKDFLVKCLTNPKVYLRTPASLAHGGWACNDLFPAWAASQLTGDPKYLADNVPFLQLMMRRPQGFPWGGVDMHYYLGELDRRGELAGIIA